ncbi:hypothetical protein Syun_009408 [Stephania yunnanensis]|uniref:F-box domain-containing protein n=1 Tax=Stephania yunnanensis TaxID=152371 RepID=A0AAP0KGB6_9MAGN
MSNLRNDLVGIVWPVPELDPVDQFDRLPDSVLLLILNKIRDVKVLGRCCVVSRRFQSIVPQVDNVVVKVDCIISDDDASSSSSSVLSSDKYSRNVFSAFVRVFVGGIVKPFQALGHFLGPKRPPLSPSSSSALCGVDDATAAAGVTHHSPTQVLRNFSDIRSLRIELPNGELGIGDAVLLKWRADFGSTLDRCVILGSSSITSDEESSSTSSSGGAGDDSGGVPEPFCTNGALKLRVVWTISSLIAASARHYLLHPIIADHQTLNSLVLTDADGQGVLCMNREQLDELRAKPLLASAASKRTLMPALNMRLWYAQHLELPDGVVLKGATLVAIRPSDQTSAKKESSDGSWVSKAFEEPYCTAAELLLKKRTYCLEMNSF